MEELGIPTDVLSEKRDFVVEKFLQHSLNEDETRVSEPSECDPYRTDSVSSCTALIDEVFEKKMERLNRSASQDDGVTDLGILRSFSPRTMSKKHPSLIARVIRLFGTDLRLVEAADEGDVNRVRQLIRAGVDIQASEKWRWTALHMAAYGGYDEIASILIANGANLNARTVDGETPLQLAERNYKVEVVRIIEEEIERRAKSHGIDQSFKEEN